MPKRRQGYQQRRLLGALTALLFFCSFLFLGHHFFALYTVDGTSMVPTLQNGDRVVLRKTEKLKAGDIVFFTKPTNWPALSPSTAPPTLVKRLAGLPGEKFYYHPGEIAIGGRSYKLPKDYNCRQASYTTTIPPNHYFFMGDNVEVSLDSRRVFCSDLEKESFVDGSAIQDHGTILWRLKL